MKDTFNNYDGQDSVNIKKAKYRVNITPLMHQLLQDTGLSEFGLFVAENITSASISAIDFQTLSKVIRDFGYITNTKKPFNRVIYTYINN
jgi:hypothetical protein